MKEIKLIVDGKEIAVLTAEQIKALGIDVDDGCVCDKTDKMESYWFVNRLGYVERTVEHNWRIDDEMFAYGNYYRDEAYAQQVALHQQLNNLLRRYSEQHGGDTEWDSRNIHYAIRYDTYLKTCDVDDYWESKFLGEVYFNNREIAESAIEEVVKPFIKEHPEFVW